MLSPRTTVRDLPSYHPPLAGRTGLRLDFNENTVGCSPRVLERLRRIDAEELARYPERQPVEEIAAGYLGTRTEELLLTNGVDEAIHLLSETYLDPGHEAFVVVPTFSMYEIFAAATGARVVAIPAGDDFSFPLSTILDRVTAATRLIAIANPNNPTGAAATSEELLRVADAAPEAAVLVDEAYFEFHGVTLLNQCRERSNIFVARTFSKAYGLAGLRLGVLWGHAEQMRAVRKVASPYNVNSVALACLPEAFADEAHVRRYVSEVREGRKRLQAELKNLGIRFWPSQANFVLMHLGRLNLEFIQRMREQGILVRDRSRDPGCADCVRITLGSAEQTDKLMSVLPNTLREIRALAQEVR